jgi:hypothetical protein
MLKQTPKPIRRWQGRGRQGGGGVNHARGRTEVAWRSPRCSATHLLLGQRARLVHLVDDAGWFRLHAHLAPAFQQCALTNTPPRCPQTAALDGTDTVTHQQLHFVERGRRHGALYRQTSVCKGGGHTRRCSGEASSSQARAQSAAQPTQHCHAPRWPTARGLCGGLEPVTATSRCIARPSPGRAARAGVQPTRREAAAVAVCAPGGTCGVFWRCVFNPTRCPRAAARRAPRDEDTTHNL